MNVCLDERMNIAALKTAYTTTLKDTQSKRYQIRRYSIVKYLPSFQHMKFQTARGESKKWPRIKRNLAYFAT